MNDAASPPPQPVDLRLAMRSWVTGVAVASTRLGERQHGMTVNSFTSISIDPPLVIVALAKTTRTYEMLLQSRILGFTILSASQQELSDRFAGRLSDEQDRFAGLATETLVTGAPFIRGGLAFIDCRLRSTVEVGLNELMLADVVAVKAADEADAEPLLYYSRAYHSLKDPHREPPH
jgi:flavin reductase (DIM6/NTAB) family NADH-FMN oxidoreductase RutF